MPDEEYGPVIEVDCATHERIERPMTTEERAHADIRRAAALAEQEAQAQKEAALQEAIGRLRDDPAMADLVTLFEALGISSQGSGIDGKPTP